MFTGGTAFRRLKQVAQIAVSNVDKKTVAGEIPVRLCNYMDVYKNDCITAGLPFMDATASSEQVVRFRLQQGDVLVTKDSETPEDIGSVAIVTEALRDVVCGYHLAVMRPRGDAISGPFLHWAMASSPVRAELSARATGSRGLG